MIFWPHDGQSADLPASQDWARNRRRQRGQATGISGGGETATGSTVAAAGAAAGAGRFAGANDEGVGTDNGRWQFKHVTCFPASDSGAANCFPQCPQVTMMSLAADGWFDGGATLAAGLPARLSLAPVAAAPLAGAAERYLLA